MFLWETWASATCKFQALRVGERRAFLFSDLLNVKVGDVRVLGGVGGEREVRETLAGSCLINRESSFFGKRIFLGEN